MVLFGARMIYSSYTITVHNWIDGSAMWLEGVMNQPLIWDERQNACIKLSSRSFQLYSDENYRFAFQTNFNKLH